MLGMHHTFSIACQISTARGHLQKVWNMYSRSSPHNGHTSVPLIWCSNLLAEVARELVATRQWNTHTLGGAEHLYIDAQTTRRPSGALLGTIEEGWSLFSSANWYTLRTAEDTVAFRPSCKDVVA